FVLANTTAATSGVPVQISPRLRFRSQVWNTTSVAATNTNDWFIESAPVSAATPSGLLQFGSSLNGAAATYPITISSLLGTLTNTSGGNNPVLLNATGHSGTPTIAVSGTNAIGLGTANVNFLAVSLASAVTSSPDIYFMRDAAAVLGIRSSTTAQKMRLYNTFTTVDTAGEWFKLDWKTTANQFRFGAVNGSSTGTARVATWDYGGVEATPTAAISVPITSGAITFGGGLILPDAGDIAVNATTGTKIGTATSQKLSVWNQITNPVMPPMSRPPRPKRC